MTPWTYVVGVTLVEFLWQGAGIAVVAAVMLRLLRRRAPDVRYAVACAALAAMLAAPVVTAYVARGQAMVVDANAPATPAAVSHMTLPPTRAAAPDVARVATASPWRRMSATSLSAVLPIAVGLWLAGVALLLARLVVGAWRVRQMRRQSLCCAVSRWRATGDRLAARLGLTRAVRFVDSVLVDTPVVIGLMRPVIVLPVAALASLTSAQVEAILAHELAHIRRHDVLVNALQAIAETLLFYHPAVWWISDRIRVEREHCCDDVAVEVCGDAVTYAEALVHLATWDAAPSLGMAVTGGPLLDRVRRLLRLEPRPARGTVATWGMAALAPIALVFVVGLHDVALARQAGDDDATWRARLAELHRIVPDFRAHDVPGPLEINRIIHFNLFPERVMFPGDDPPEARAWGVTVTYPGGEQMVKGFTARSLIRYAYGLDGNAVIDVPAWMDHQAVALHAHAISASPDTEDVLFAIRTALDAQMHVALRYQVRDYPVYSLVLAGADGSLGPNIRRAVAGECFTSDMLREYAADHRPLPSRQRTPMCGVENSATGPSMLGVSMPELARAIERWTPDRPVVDRTGLTGTFDVRLQLGFVPFAGILTAHPDAAGVLKAFGVRTMREALPEQLGLALEDATAPYQVVVVEANR